MMAVGTQRRPGARGRWETATLPGQGEPHKEACLTHQRDPARGEKADIEQCPGSAISGRGQVQQKSITRLSRQRAAGTPRECSARELWRR
jgi:hypothetical protein